MEYKLRDVLNLNESEISNSKIELNMSKGNGGMPFIDIWMQNDLKKRENGNCMNSSYWPKYGEKLNFNTGELVFSFVRMSNFSNDNWLFVSAGEILSINQKKTKVKIIKKYKPLFGRLIVKLKKGNTYSRFTFHLKKYIDDAVVLEVLPHVYNGDVFSGYDNINIQYSKLSDILNQKVSPTYYEALSKITGIYCLTDTKNGNLYIGSASGSGGVIQRWKNYFSSKDGGNKKLIELKRTKGEDYFNKYFTFTLIEYFGLYYDESKIKQREQYWKRCLDTINHGYNCN